MDSQHNKILVGGMAALMLLSLAVPVSKGKFLLWVILVAVCYSLFYFWYMKFNVVKSEILELTQKQQAGFKAYVTVRQKRIKTALFLLITGFLLVLVAVFSPDKQTIGILVLVGLLVMTSGAIIYFQARCPFCHKVTTYIPSRFGCRCMYCHRKIDID